MINSVEFVEQIKFNDILLHKLKEFDSRGVYLNFGIGQGCFEICNSASVLYASNVEFEKEIDLHKQTRDFFEIRLDYTCSDIYDDTFEIYNCKTYFNYILLSRFFCVHQEDECERIEFVLTKLAPYAQNALIIDSTNKWSKREEEYLKVNSKNIINITNDHNCWVVELKRMYEIV